MDRRTGSSGGAAPDAEAEELARVVTRVVRARVRDHHLAEDIVQETLARVLARRPALEPDDLRPYAITTALNLVASGLRSDSRRARNAHRLLDIRSVELPEDEVLRQDERRSMSRAMATLSDRDRDVLISHEVLDITTRALADSDGTTSGAIAVRLAAARAKLRLEYVLSHRREAPLPARCRSVLVALSAGDRRRQVALDAEDHLSSCERCAGLSEPLLRRRRASAALLPVLALRTALARAGAKARRNPFRTASIAAAAVASVVLVGQATMDGPAAPQPAPEVPGAIAAAPGGSAPVTMFGTSLGTMTPDRLQALVGQPVTVRAAVVSAVPADEGFWLEDGTGGRVWVQMGASGESPVTIEPGSTVSFSGRLAATPPEMTSKVGLDVSEGAEELSRHGFHIEVPAREITLG